jgi:hypothetical protein
MFGLDPKNYVFEKKLIDGLGKYRYERKMVGDLVRVLDEIIVIYILYDVKFGLLLLFLHLYF